MLIHVKLFAILRDLAGKPELTLDLPTGTTVHAAGVALGEAVPALKEHLPHTGFAVNRTYAGPAQVLEDGDELAAIPPVSGG
jgi:molybdopterin converting factor subunit 1